MLHFDATTGCSWIRTESVHTVPHAQWGVAVLVGLDGPVHVEGAEGRAHGRVVVVPAALEHVTSSSGPVVSIMLDADHHRGAVVESRRLQPFSVGESSLVALAESMTRPTPTTSPATALTLASRVLPLGRAPIGDARLAAYLRENESAKPTSLCALAAHLGLTPGHLSTLFHTRVGIPFRRWVLWRRLMNAVPYLRPGGLADAAQAAGFADQAHLSRTCARLLGYTPRALAELRGVVAARH
jgi:AraC-like DNA-binding protein